MGLHRMHGAGHRDCCGGAASAKALILLCAALGSSVSADEEKPRGEYSWVIGPQCGLDQQTGGHWFNLGPTGIRAKIDASARREFIVTYVFADSPAHEKILAADRIVGVNGRKFQDPELFALGYSGPRMELGKAIEESEGDPALKGRLTFMVVRNGKNMEVVVQLRHLGYFAKNFPFDCKKSRVLVKDACDWITRPIDMKLQSVGVEFTPGIHIAGHWHTQTACTMALMAQGDTYMPLLKEHYRDRMERDDSKGASEYTAQGDGMWTFCEALQMIELVEWYMLTQDRAALSPIKYHESVMCYCQHPNGGFEHGKIKSVYGTMSFPAGLACIGWAIMKQAGIEINEEAYLRSRNALTCCTAPSGEMWYSLDPLPSAGWVVPPVVDIRSAGKRDTTCGGRGGTATLMHFLDPMDSCSDSYVRRGVTHLAACADRLMDGHASAAVNAQWSMIAMSIAPVVGDMKSYRQMMDYYKYWFNLNRCHDGSFYQPPCTDGSIDPFGDIHYITTGWVILALSAPQRGLAILGRDPLTPGIDKETLSKGAQQIHQAIRFRQGQPAALLKNIDALKKGAHEQEAKALGMMEARLTKPMQDKLVELKRLEAERDFYELSEGLKAADVRYRGVAEYDERTMPQRQILGEKDAQKHVATGKTFVTRIVPLFDTTAGRAEKKGSILKATDDFLASDPGEPYASRAKKLFGGLIAELDQQFAEITAAERAGDVTLAARKLAKADAEFGGFAPYMEKATPVRDALKSSSSNKAKQIGDGYYRLIESKMAKGKLLQALDRFIHTHGDADPYGAMARKHKDQLLAEVDTLVGHLADLKSSGDMYSVWKALVDGDKEYGTLAPYVEKTRDFKMELNTEANRELIKVGASYHALEAAMKKNPSDEARKQVVAFIVENPHNIYGEKAKALIGGQP